MNNKLTLWLSEKRYFIEALLATLSAVSILIKWLGIAKDDPVIMITMSILAGFYFISAYFVTDVKGTIGQIIIKVVGLGSAISVTGIQFFILKMHGYDEILIIGGNVLAVAFVISLVLMIGSRNREYFPFAIRALIFATISTLILMSGSPIAH